MFDQFIVQYATSPFDPLARPSVAEFLVVMTVGRSNAGSVNTIAVDITARNVNAGITSINP